MSALTAFEAFRQRLAPIMIPSVLENYENITSKGSCIESKTILASFNDDVRVFDSRKRAEVKDYEAKALTINPINFRRAESESAATLVTPTQTQGSRVCEAVGVSPCDDYKVCPVPTPTPTDVSDAQLTNPATLLGRVGQDRDTFAWLNDQADQKYIIPPINASPVAQLPESATLLGRVGQDRDMLAWLNDQAERKRITLDNESCIDYDQALEAQGSDAPELISPDETEIVVYCTDCDIVLEAPEKESGVCIECQPNVVHNAPELISPDETEVVVYCTDCGNVLEAPRERKAGLCVGCLPPVSQSKPCNEAATKISAGDASSECSTEVCPLVKFGYKTDPTNPEDIWFREDNVLEVCRRCKREHKPVRVNGKFVNMCSACMGSWDVKVADFGEARTVCRDCWTRSGTMMLGSEIISFNFQCACEANDLPSLDEDDFTAVLHNGFRAPKSSINFLDDLVPNRCWYYFGQREYNQSKVEEVLTQEDYPFSEVARQSEVAHLQLICSQEEDVDECGYERVNGMPLQFCDRCDCDMSANFANDRFYCPNCVCTRAAKIEIDASDHMERKRKYTANMQPLIEISGYNDQATHSVRQTSNDDVWGEEDPEYIERCNAEETQ